MNRARSTARYVGSAFLISNVTFILGAVVLVEAILGAPDYLSLASANRAQIILGVLFEWINAIAFVGIAVLMFPILRRRFESLALAYVGFRIVEFVTQILADVGALSLLLLSEEFVKAGSPASSAFLTVGATLLDVRFWSFQMLYLIFSLSGLLFYYMLYRTDLIPRFVSIWGLAGAALVLFQTLVDMFGLTLDPSISVITGLPMLLNELFLGIWLIAKGFNPSAAILEAAQ
ncbi:MAG: DUF4386 domain-containing protein [Anaerolineales bacterium]